MYNGKFPYTYSQTTFFDESLISLVGLHKNTNIEC